MYIYERVFELYEENLRALVLGILLYVSPFKLSLTADIILMAVNLRYTIIDLIIKAVNFLISS